MVQEVKKKKVVSKGYTITISSWENDGDFSNTESIVLQSLDDVRLTNQIINDLFSTIGNSMGGKHNDFVVDYFSKNGHLLEFIAKDWTERNWAVTDKEELHEMILETFHKWSGELLGYSESYDYRVFDGMSITYCDKNIYCQILEL